VTDHREKTPPATGYLTVAQLAKRQQRSERSIFRDIANGKLVQHKFGKSVRIAIDDAAAYEALSRRKKNLC
jgi:hypothetical protein